MVGPSAVSADAALAALRACRLFAGLDDESLGLVAAALRPRRFRRAETVFHAGDPGDALFIVESGQVKITLPPDDGSEPAILTTIGPTTRIAMPAAYSSKPHLRTFITQASQLR